MDNWAKKCTHWDKCHGYKIMLEMFMLKRLFGMPNEILHDWQDWRVCHSNKSYFFLQKSHEDFLKNEDIYKYIIAALCLTKKEIYKYLCRINVPMYRYIDLKLQMLLDDCVSFLAEHKIFKQISWEHVQKCQIFLVKHPVLITSWLIEFF